VIATRDDQPIGAAWVRLFLGNDKTGAYLDDHTPELAIAVHPDQIGQGVGTALLRELFEVARGRYGPYMTASGTLHINPGYDPESRLREHVHP
jgi:GNAT superfamily N-acetyltransferase